MTNQEYWEKLTEKYENMPMSDFAKLVNDLDEMGLNPFAISEECVDENASYNETKIIDDVRELKDLIKNEKKGFISKYPTKPERSCYMDGISFQWDPEESAYYIHSQRNSFKPSEFSSEGYLYLEELLYEILQDISRFSYMEISITSNTDTNVVYTTSDAFGENVHQFFRDSSIELLKNASTDLYET